eukprot:CAMPEP_0168313276 /NCGR_PEP_ID=MMETSP0210-20121227/768_1 /TAXON_ID=40633 /ORGANISM="Condylostoma magnum, Strain COL2" /LENGTH=66 /DNA_ID=CAMNT_0008267649 /DNA_START=395 /DNA_END=592 /DNA_ORIENTATION=+
MTQEMMSDAVDMALEDPNDAEQSEEVVQQVLSEIGIEIGDQLGNGGVGNLAPREEAKVGAGDDLES